MDFEQDKLNIFREISNIGSGNASTSLAQLLNEIVDIGIPNSDLREFSDITKSYKSPDELVVGTVLQISGDLEGFIMVVMGVDSTLNLLSRLTGKKIDCDKTNYEQVCKELNSVGEICNILCGTYLTAMSQMTGMSISQSVPYFSVDMIRAIMNLPATLYADMADSILCIETEFFTLDREIEGKYYFIPKIESCKKLLSSLGFGD
jgi:chemotaxis protein CheC